ncbi:MAG: TetR/AcrR family transcriptional regulator [Proteobacteria bacterium]|nr:TetR/AcrR family transcriptional regulator [Pseudomonadota bacterium]
MAPKKSKTGVQLGEPVVRGMVMMAAARIFAELGYRPTSVEDLLAAANVSRRTFYKVFSSKDDVGVALYKFGTTTLLASCRQALSDDADLLTKVTRCIDLHLKNAGSMGRLVYVLGGEASHQESPLFVARTEVHDRLCEMLLAAGGMRVDPLFVRTLILALEAIVRNVLIMSDEGRKVTEENIARARRVMVRITTGAIAGEGPSMPDMPLWP